jgi:hypothetical protein
MNFMPSEDVFFDEPISTDMTGIAFVHVPPPAGYQAVEAPTEVSPHDLLSKLVDSSLRQEALLEKLVGEIERMNTRLLTVELTSGMRGTRSSSPMSTSDSVEKPRSDSAARLPTVRGTLLLPPGSRPILPNSVSRGTPQPVIPSEDPMERERKEQEAIQQMRADEETRLLRMEVERKQREEEEARKRAEHLRKLEETKRQKEELEKRTKGLLNDLLVPQSGKGLFDSDDEPDILAGDQTKARKGLFDD